MHGSSGFRLGAGAGKARTACPSRIMHRGRSLVVRTLRLPFVATKFAVSEPFVAPK